jgi:hypothetical protein
MTSSDKVNFFSIKAVFSGVALRLNLRLILNYYERQLDDWQAVINRKIVIRQQWVQAVSKRMAKSIGENNYSTVFLIFAF